MAYAMHPTGEVFLDARAEQRLGEARRRFLVVSMCYLDLPVRRPDVAAMRHARASWMDDAMRGAATTDRGGRSTPPPAP